jgi:hypothetical protein
LGKVLCDLKYEDKREFHKYISKLILKDSDGLYDYLKGAKKENI